MSFTTEMWKGLALAILLNIVNYVVSVLVFLSSLGSCGPYGIRGDIACVLLPFWGITQLVYLAPMIWIARRNGKMDFSLGLIIGLGVTLITNLGTYPIHDPTMMALAKVVDQFSYWFGFRK